jgi:FlgD Ig-like domain
MDMSTRLFPIAVLALVFSPATALGSWSNDGFPVAWAAAQQIYPVVTSDGSGGAIIAWQDGRAGDFNIYAQRINQNGIAMWLPNGVAVCTAANDQVAPQIVSDGAGGAIVTWFDFRNGTDNNIYASRINPSGVAQWTANGVAVCTAADDQANVIMAPDGSGGAIIAWDDNRNLTDYNTYVQRINSLGAPQYTANGVAACLATGNQFVTSLVPNGTGAAIVVWYDSRSGTDSDVYAQRVNSLGGVSWAADGVALAATTGDQDSPVATSDGSGGAIVAWDDLRGGLTYDIYAQHINSTGSLQWTINGVSVCSSANNQSFPTITTDDAGGAIVSWQDARNGSNAVDIYAQRLNGSGATQWTNDGVSLCAAIGSQDHPVIAADGYGGAIAVWNDGRNGNPDIFSQRVNASGATQWLANGQPVVQALAKQASPTLVVVPGGGAIFTWQDFRDDIKGDIYAARLTGSGSVPTGVDGATPGFFVVGDNRPNPFSSTTTFDLTLEEASQVSADVYDVAGHRVRSMELGAVNAGAALLQFDGLDDQTRSLPSGVYFLRVRAGSETITKKMVLAR